MVRTVVVAAAVTLVVVYACVGVVVSLQQIPGYDIEWEQWKLQYGKTYRSEIEEEARHAVFTSNLLYINSFNARAENTYKLAINHFADRTPAEFSDFVLSHAPRIGSPRYFNPPVGTIPPTSTPDGSIDYRNISCVGKVMDQGQCGSSWAIVAVNTAQSDYCAQKTTPVLQEMSIQQVIDCDKYSLGCNGGTSASALDYIVKYGLEPASAYPYTGKTGECHYAAEKVVEKFASVIKVEQGNEDDLTAKLFSYGPAAVAVDASGMQFYSSGIFCGPCTQTVNHEMLLIGYNQDSYHDKNYWILQNSWGATWGQSGYINLCRDQGNKCGIASQAAVLKIA